MMGVAKPLEIEMSRLVERAATRGRSGVVLGVFLFCVLLPVWSMAGVATSLAGAVDLSFLQCGCLCVEGIPQTLCSSVEEAQLRPSLCGQQHCPDYVAVEEQGSRYVSPHAFADNCRDVRIWDAGREAYDGIKVCDVLELSRPPGR
jgi:hypothetical protein